MYEYKEIGETTSEFSNRIKNKLKCKKVCIIGKLDPMAQGYTRILIDSETKLMSKYLNSDKNYTFSLVIGFSTDTDDIMGKIEKSMSSIDHVSSNELVDLITNEIHNYCLCTIQKFHKFSAIKINKNGINTSLHSINNLLDEDIPEKEVKVYDLIQLNKYTIINSIKYKELIFERLDKVNDKKTFRIDEIKNLYIFDNEISNIYMSNEFNMISIDYNITVSSGFYIRMIANHIKNKLNIPVHIYNITRGILNNLD
jgi:tRNA pseudouridine(55) synthase